MAAPNKANNTAGFDNLDVGKNSVEVDGFRYPGDSVKVDHFTNNHLDQYRDLKPFCNEHVGELLLSPFVKFSDLKNFYPFQVVQLTYDIMFII